MLLNDDLSLAKIGEKTGGLDHATVLNSKHRIDYLIATDRQIRYDVIQIEKRLKNKFEIKKSILNGIKYLI